MALCPDGQIVCSAVLRSLGDLAPEVRMRDRDRPLFPSEQVHGRGVFDRLRGEKVGSVRPPLVDPTADQVARLEQIIEGGLKTLADHEAGR